MVMVIGDQPSFFLRHSTSFLLTKYILLLVINKLIFLVDTNFCSTKFFSKFFNFLGKTEDVDLGIK